MFSLTKTKLSDLCIVVDCEHKTAPTQEVGIPLIRTPNIGRGRLIFDNVQRISDATFKKWTRRSVPKRNDLIMAREAPVGNVAIIPPRTQVCLGQRTVLIRVQDGSEIAPAYLNYVLNSSAMHAYLNLLATGATVGHLNVTDIRNLELPEFPGYLVQRKIAAVLSGYDDLIENNRRRIAILEKMAEEIYREWFVRMRFPGHETTKFEKGLPIDWDIVRVKSLVDRKAFGRIYRESELHPEGSVVVIDQSRSENIGYHSEKPDHNASPESPITIFGDHSCKMLLMTKPFSLAENVIPFIPKVGTSRYFLFHLVKDLAKTTEYKRHWSDLTNKEVIVPKAKLQTDFDRIASLLHTLMEGLKDQVGILSKTRDQLLPRLVSGKLSVEDFDIQFPPSMIEEEQSEPEAAYA